MRLQAKTCTVYYAPTKRRRYFSAKAAADAEASAIMSNKYPMETDDLSGIWHWSSDDRHVATRARLARWILRAFYARSKEAPQ